LFLPTRDLARVVPMFYYPDPVPKVQRVLVVRGVIQRLRGLLDRDRLALDEGMLFETGNALHTRGMKFALDVLWLRRVTGLGRHVYDVLQAEECLKPGVDRKCARAEAFVELAGGLLRQLGDIPAIVSFGSVEGKL
jgi:hypothetical protein